MNKVLVFYFSVGEIFTLIHPLQINNEIDQYTSVPRQNYIKIGKYQDHESYDYKINIQLIYSLLLYMIALTTKIGCIGVFGVTH